MFKLIKAENSSAEDQQYSILIPTWNNLELLKLCIRSIRENSHFKHQIIVIVNEGIDGTLDWVKQQADIDYVYAEKNIGICYGLNSCRSLIKTDYVVYVNDDMYLLPDWDLELQKEVDQIGHNYFMLSSTSIEPVDENKGIAIVKDYGDSPDTFEEEKLLAEFGSLEMYDWQGSTWPPNLVHIELWDLVGGMSIEFSPGFYSDPDLSMKMWKAGVRYFKGVAASKAYHFVSKSTHRIKRSRGSDIFLQKWGITARTFTATILKRGQRWDKRDQKQSIGSGERLRNRLKRVYKSLTTSDFPD